MTTMLIWDLDGTIVDSYRVIVDTVLALAAELGAPVKEADVRATVLKTSVSDYLHHLCETTKADFATVKKRYSAISRHQDGAIELMPYAYETFCALREMDVVNCIFTHRGESTAGLLSRLRIDGFFREALTSASGFPRKPQPQAIQYLMEKYDGDFSRSFYIGDRDIDARCAKNAGMRSVLLQSPYVSFKADYSIPDLREVCAIV